MKVWARLIPETCLQGDSTWIRPVRLYVFLVPREEVERPLIFSHYSEVIEADCNCLPSVLVETLTVLLMDLGLGVEKVRETLSKGVSIEGP
jgi:hypothetical protein